MADFLATTRAARKVLVCDLGFLGDTIHLFPSLRAVREAYPQAELHVMVADHVKELLRLLPWIDRVWGYPRFPTSPPWYRLLPLVRALRAERFDAVINLNGSNRSSFLTRLTGAPARLGRVPERRGGPLWPLCFTHAVEIPYDDAVPVHAQRRAALGAAGFPLPAGDPFAALGAVVPPEVAARTGLLLDGLTGFVHLSPFTTLDAKELHPDDLAAVLNAVAARFPSLPWVVTCAAAERERAKLAALLPRLAFVPEKVFPGTLSLLEFAALMGRARFHLGGDSGGVHLATLRGVPSVVWFRDPPASGWTPRGPRDAVVPCPRDATGFLRSGPEPFVVAAARAAE